MRRRVEGRTCAYKDRQQNRNLDYPPQAALQVVPTPAHAEILPSINIKCEKDLHVHTLLTPHHQAVSSTEPRSQWSLMKYLRNQPND